MFLVYTVQLLLLIFSSVSLCRLLPVLCLPHYVGCSVVSSVWETVVSPVLKSPSPFVSQRCLCLCVAPSLSLCLISFSGLHVSPCVSFHVFPICHVFSPAVTVSVFVSQYVRVPSPVSISLTCLKSASL